MPRTIAACERDPVKYANRPEEKSFDPMKAVREMLAKLNAVPVKNTHMLSGHDSHASIGVWTVVDYKPGSLTARGRLTGSPVDDVLVTLP